uniref:Uncharacterized protein n=1 Tax=Brassica oleracea TaxID=3712 RepID=A0A3P6CVW3_BRAOL|nr:unnamed protein product [Brassica oleracea]
MGKIITRRLGKLGSEATCCMDHQEPARMENKIKMKARLHSLDF